MQVLGTSAATSALLGGAQTSALLKPRAAQTQSSNGTSSSSGSSSTDPTASLTSEQTFLQLLIAQIQNQDPLNPTDSIQFVGQLVQYSELEQLIGINQGVQALGGSGTSSTSGTSGSTNPTSGS